MQGVWASTSLNIEIDLLGEANLQYNFDNEAYLLKLTNEKDIFLSEGLVIENGNLIIPEEGIYVVEYKLNNLVDKIDGIWKLNLKEEGYIDNLKITLPREFMILSLDPLDSVSFDSENIIIEWTFIQPNEISLEYMLGESGDSFFDRILTVILYVFLIIFIIIIIAYILKKKGFFEILQKRERKGFTKKQWNIYLTLSHAEQLILNELKQVKDSVLTQKQISIKTNLAKSTTSRWVDSLCKKQILECSDSTFIKKVAFSEWFKKL